MPFFLQKSRTSSKKIRKWQHDSSWYFIATFCVIWTKIVSKIEYEYYHLRQIYSSYLPPFNLSLSCGLTFFVLKRHELTVFLETVNNGRKPLFARGKLGVFFLTGRKMAMYIRKDWWRFCKRGINLHILGGAISILVFARRKALGSAWHISGCILILWTEANPQGTFSSAKNESRVIQLIHGKYSVQQL